MKAVIALDSFKGSLTSRQAGEAVASGARAAGVEEVVVKPLADGGEGTAQALVEALGGEFVTATVRGPLLEPVECRYGLIEDGKTAVIDMALAAGLPLVPETLRNPMETTTVGVGELISHALDRGCRHFLIGLGGSATNDGGTGMLMGLGYSLSDARGRCIPYGAKGLWSLQSISGGRPELRECTFRVACDVTNPLCGPNGCSVVFGPQKGANDAMVTQMDWMLGDYAALAARLTGRERANAPGAGAAGGLGFAFLTFLQAVLEPGIEIVMDVTGLKEELKSADIVVTGEGKLDAQTAMGKGPCGVANVAKEFRKPVIAFAGSVQPEAKILHTRGVDALFPIVRGPVTLEQAMQPAAAAQNLCAAAEEAFRLVRACWRPK